MQYARVRFCPQAGTLKFSHHTPSLRYQAYPTIVGAGRNSAILHYSRNSAPIQEGDLVLVDAGGEILNYAADITRTFPASGKFNDKQRRIYSMVLDIQKKLIENIKPGINFLSDLSTLCSKLVCEAGVQVRNTRFFLSNFTANLTVILCAAWYIQRSNR